MKRDKMLDINKIKDRIIFELNYWNKEHNPDDINLDSNLYNIGLDRSDVVTICCEFSDSLKIDMPLEDMEEIIKTIRDLYNYFNVEDTKMQEEIEKVEESGPRIEIIDDVKVIDYSKGNKLHIRFNYRGDTTEDGQAGSFEDGGHIEFKFNDPRDTLKFLAKKLELFDGVVVSKLFEYANSIDAMKIYNQLEIYYLLILEVKIPYLYFFAVNNPLPKKDLKDYSPEELELYKITVNKFHDEYEDAIRTAHKYAVANTWKVWNDCQYFYNKKDIETSEYAPTKEQILRCSIPKETIFDKEYKGKEVDSAVGFNLHRREWQVFFKDGSWILAGDQGNGWYNALTDFNSYKIL